MYLKWKRCDEVILREKQAEDKEWDQHELKAMNIIYSSISNDQLQFVVEQATAKEVLEKLDQIFVKKSTSLQIVIRNKLDKLKLKDFENSKNFFNEFERLINDLKSAGASVNEQEKLDYMLKTLPESLAHIGDLVDILKEDDRNCNYVKTKIQSMKHSLVVIITKNQVYSKWKEKKLNASTVTKGGILKKNAKLIMFPILVYVDNGEEVYQTNVEIGEEAILDEALGTETTIDHKIIIIRTSEEATITIQEGFTTREEVMDIEVVTQDFKTRAIIGAITMRDLRVMKGMFKIILINR